MDITQLILDDHREQRRLFALLEEIPLTDTHSLTALWARLSTFLEVHAEAEEQHFYPALLKVGEGAGGRADAADETRDAIKDHNELRKAVAAVSKTTVGTPQWQEAVDAANKANGDHMAEEEREGLTDFRRNAPPETRHALGVLFITFESANRGGVTPVDKNPKAYVRENE